MHINNAFLYKNKNSFDFLWFLKGFLNKHDCNFDHASQIKTVCLYLDLCPWRHQKKFITWINSSISPNSPSCFYIKWYCASSPNCFTQSTWVFSYTIKLHINSASHSNINHISYILQIVSFEEFYFFVDVFNFTSLLHLSDSNHEPRYHFWKLAVINQRFYVCRIWDS